MGPGSARAGKAGAVRAACGQGGAGRLRFTPVCSASHMSFQGALLMKRSSGQMTL